VILIDTLYEARVVDCVRRRARMLYMEGEGVFEFERTASRLRECGAQTGPIEVTD
jgi:cell division protein ZapE